MEKPAADREAPRGLATLATRVAVLKEALAVFHAPHELEASLLAVQLRADAAGVRRVIEEALVRLDQSLEYQDAAALLRATYFGPRVKQRAVAAELGVPFGTFRYRLQRALERLARELPS